jgi:4-hydroxy-3-polyprenylbenzoate decarboxylase
VKEYLVVITGESGSVYGLRLVERLLSGGAAVTLVVTKAGRDVMASETALTLPESGLADALLRFLALPTSLPLRMAEPSDLFDRVASGSGAPDAMIVCPASMGFVASVAAGIVRDLPERAAEVMLKECRPLLLVPRETPLSLIHLRNLTAVTEAGAVVVPAMPAFYANPASLDDMVNFVVGKVLDVLGVEHDLYRRRTEQP